MNATTTSNVTTKKMQRMLTKPINLLFRLFQTQTRVQIWLYQQADIKFEAKIIGFDEYMNLVLEDCEEIHVKKNTRSFLGRLMLKGDNVSLIRAIEANSG